MSWSAVLARYALARLIFQQPILPFAKVTAALSRPKVNIERPTNTVRRFLSGLRDANQASDCQPILLVRRNFVRHFLNQEETAITSSLLIKGSKSTKLVSLESLLGAASKQSSSAPAGACGYQKIKDTSRGDPRGRQREVSLRLRKACEIIWGDPLQRTSGTIKIISRDPT